MYGYTAYFEEGNYARKWAASLEDFDVYHMMTLITVNVLLLMRENLEIYAKWEIAFWEAIFIMCMNVPASSVAYRA